MVFCSAAFLLLFLPATFAASSLALRHSSAASIHVLLVASLIYYGIWNWQNLFVLVPLALFTYWGALRFERSRSWFWPLAVISVNLGSLAYFKYAAFFADTLRLAW